MQTSFGSFNHRFIGVKLRFKSRFAIDQFFLAFNGALTPHATEAQNREQIWACSVFEHELRHFHDFLISPYSSSILRLRIAGSVNGTSYLENVLREAHGSPNACLPVPLSAWAFCDLTSRSRQRAMWRALSPPSDGGAWAPIPIPYLRNIKSTIDMERLELEWDQPISDERKGLLGALIAITINGYESMDQYSRGFAAQLGVHELRPADVFEIRALLAQAHVVLRSLDAKSYQDFYSETIMNMRYGRPFAYFVQPFMKHGVPFDSFVSHAALMWAILGRPITGSDEKGAIIFACPAYRLAFLVQRFEKLGPPDHRTAQECFDEWDAALGCISVRNGLESVLRANTRALNHYKKMGKKFRHPEALTIMFSNFRKAQRRAVKKFLESPEDYIESDRYHTSLQYFPWPPIRIEMEGFALSRQEVQRYLDAWGSIAAPGAIEHDQCDTILIRSLDDSFDMAACSNAAEILASADYCFQMRGRADEELVAANRKLSQDSAIRRFNVF